MATFSEWTRRKDQSCKFCGQKGGVEYRVYEASDGGHEDTQYYCANCDKKWWEDGIDS